jgi:hypothetical protein
VPLPRIRQILADVATFQDVSAEKPQRADLGDHGSDRESPLLEKKQVVPPELRRREPRKAPTAMRVERSNNLDVTADRGRGVIAAYQLVTEKLQQLGHRHLL